MNTEFFATSICERLLSAAANGVYQGALVALLAGLALRWFPRTNAATRHAVWFGVLLFVAALIPAHFLLSSQPRQSHPDAAAPTPVAAGNPIISGADISDPPPDAFNDSGIDNTQRLPDFVPQYARSESGARESASRQSTAWNFEAGLSLPHSVCLTLIAIWALLASVRGGMVAWRIGEVRRAKKTAAAPTERLQTLFDRLRERLPSRRHVGLKISSEHRTAVVLGFFHPAVLLPAEMEQEANDSEIEHVLRHELAHVDRRDDWANLAQQVIQGALFFHPAIWWISARLSLEREVACDDHVLEASGGPRAYALTLANIASRMSQRGPLLAPGVSNNSSQLQQRITMILNTQRDRSPRLARRRLGLFAAATAALAVLAIIAGPRLVLAQSPAPDAEIASVTPAALPPDASGPDSAPRAKPLLSDDDAAPFAAPTPAIPAAPPAASIAVVRPVPIEISTQADVAAAPNVSITPAPAPPHESKRHMSVEERLDRIEKMLDEMGARKGLKGPRHAANGLYFQPDMPPMPAMPGMSSEDYTIITKRASEQAQRAVEQAQRSMEASRRATDQVMRDMAKLSAEDYGRAQAKGHDGDSAGLSQEIESLRNARQTLQSQLRNLERQLKRLEDGQKDQKRSKIDGKSDDQNSQN
ncbi:MAG TPA: M56 family metallopeptidase [Verrucomicrobiae bacterium]|jgi:beta-lactamase regulating signal transducer with metallopeptidase domain